MSTLGNVTVKHDENKFQKIIQECELLEEVKHDHITVHDDKTQEGGVLLVMEFMDQSLETFLKDNRGNLSKEKQVDICQQVASGLRYIRTEISVKI